MVGVRDPVGVDPTDDGPTSPQSAAATGTDVRVAARALESRGVGPTVVRRRVSAQVLVGGGLLVALLVVLAVSVVWVSRDSKHPLVQPNPSPPATSAPTSSPTVAAGPIPLPVSATQQAPTADTPTAPVEALSPSQVTAETMTPAAPPIVGSQFRWHLARGMTSEFPPVSHSDGGRFVSWMASFPQTSDPAGRPPDGGPRCWLQALYSNREKDGGDTEFRRRRRPQREQATRRAKPRRSHHSPGASNLANDGSDICTHV
jgi:hypothetical protein